MKAWKLMSGRRVFSAVNRETKQISNLDTLTLPSTTLHDIITCISLKPFVDPCLEIQEGF